MSLQNRFDHRQTDLQIRVHVYDIFCEDNARMNEETMRKNILQYKKTKLHI